MAEALVINDTSWSGPAAEYMITRSVVGADTIEKGCIYVEDGIRKKKAIPRIEVANFIQKRKATPTSSGDVTVDGRVLEPRDYMMYYEFNPRDFESHFYAENLKPKLLTRDLPNPVESFMVMQQMKRLNEFNENAIWRSRIDYDPDGANVDPTTKGESADASAYLYMDGLIKKALDASDTLWVASPVALTSSNIVAKMELALKLVPKGLLFKYGKGGVKYMMSYADKQKYDDFQANLQAYKGIDTTQAGIMKYKNYEVECLAGLPENTFFLAISKPDIDSNGWLGINSTEDNAIQLQRLQNNSELYFAKGLFKADTQWGFTDQLIGYTTLTA